MSAAVTINFGHVAAQPLFAKMASFYEGGHLILLAIFGLFDHLRGSDHIQPFRIRHFSDTTSVLSFAL